MNNKFNILLSLPVILLALYFLPFIGIVLAFIRFFTENKKIIPTFFIVGILLIIPKIIHELSIVLKISDYFKINNFVNNKIYLDLIVYSKFLIILALFMLIFQYLFKKAKEKASSHLRNYISSKENEERKISIENDLKIKEKQEAAKNTYTVMCPYCGADNLITSRNGTCKYCRRKISVE